MENQVENIVKNSAGNSISALAYGNITESVRAAIRRWHGSIDDQFANIDNVVNILTAHQSTWIIPTDLLAQLTANRNQLQEALNSKI